MARRKNSGLSLSDLDFSRGGGPDWAVRERQAFLQEKSAREQAESNEAENILKLMEQDGIEITDDIARQVLGNVERGESGYRRKEPKDFSNVTSDGSLGSVPVRDDSFFKSSDFDGTRPAADVIVDRVAGSISDFFTKNIGALADNAQADAQEAARAQLLTASTARHPALRGLARQANVYADLARGDLQGMLDSGAFDPTKATKDVIAANAERLAKSAKDNRAPAAAIRKELEQGDWGQRNIGTAIVDASGSMTSGAASLLGGPAGLIAVQDVFAREYQSALEEGLSDDEATQYAWTKAAPESIAVIPAGKVLERIPGLGKVFDVAKKKVAKNMARKVANPVVTAAAQIAKTAVGEGLEETATGTLQDASDMFMAGQAESERIRALAGKNAPKSLDEFIERRGTEFRAGAVMGGTLTAAPSGVNAVREYNSNVEQQSDETTRQVLERRAAEQARAAAEAPPVQDVPRREQRAEPEQGDLFDTPEGLPTAEEYAEQRRKEAEEDAAWAINQRRDRTDEVRAANLEERKANVQRRVDTAQDQVEMLQDRMDDGDYSSGTRNALTQRLADLREAQGQLDSINGETVTRPAETETVQTTTPAADPVQGELSFPRAEQPATKARAKKEAAKRTRKAPVVTAPAPAPVAAPVATKAEKQEAAPTQIPEPTINDQDLTEDALRKLADVLLPPKTTDSSRRENMPEQGQTEADVRDTITRTIRALGQKNSNASTDIQNLLRTGKLNFARNPAEIGAPADSGAVYNRENGQMTIFTEGLNPDDVGATIAYALHESTHVGQNNGRKGRDSVMSSFMSKSDQSAARGVVEEAARKGNKIAERAVERARESGAYDTELLAYFASEASKARGSSLGQLRGIANDMVAKANSWVRKAGFNVDINMADIDSAAQRTAGEALATDTSNTRGGRGMDQMIVGASTPGIEAARQRGTTYRGRIDGQERYEISDANSSLDTDGPAWQEMLDGGDVFLGEIFAHDNLYQQYPELAELKVKYDPNMHAFGSFGNNLLTLGPRPVAKAKLASDGIGARSTLLHEIQHWIQEKEGFVQGANPGEFANQQLSANVDFLRSSMTRQEKYIQDNLPFALATLPRSARMEFNQTIADDAALMGEDVSGSYKAMLFLMEFADGSTDSGMRDRAARYADTDTKFREAMDAYKADYAEAMKKYTSVYGEAEARNTQARADFTQEQLDNNARPEETMGRMPVAPIDVKDTTDNDGNKRMDASSREPKQQAPAERQSMKERLRRLIDHGVRSQTADVKLAEAMDTHYQRAFQADVGRGDAAAANADINRMLADIESANDAERTQFIENFRAKYPRLAVVLSEMRNKIDANTVEYVRQVLDSGRPMTPSEIRQVQTLLQNRGKYLTRAYSAFQPRVGRPWAENTWSNYKANIAAYLQDPSSIKDPRKRAAVEAVLGGIKFLEKQFIIPNDTTLDDMSMADLETLYEDHVGRVEDMFIPKGDDQIAAKRGALISAIATKREAIPMDQINRMAEQAAKEMLGLAERTTNVSKAFTDLARKPGTLKQRKNVPEELRKMLGEIDDPAGRVLATLTTQAALIARMNVLSDLAKGQNGTMVIPGDRINEEGMRERFPHQLKGRDYGPLDGWYVTEGVAAAIKDSITTFNSFKELLNATIAAPNRENSMGLMMKVGGATLRGTARLTRFEKMFGVVGRPVNWIGNLGGSGLNLLRSGNFSPSSYATGALTGVDYIKGTIWDTSTALLDDALRYVNVEAVDVAEMQRVAADKLSGYLAGTVSPLNVVDQLLGMGGKTSGFVGRQQRRILSGYAMSDAWTKIANFHQRANMLKAYYDATGVKKSMEEIKREAGDTTSYTNISNERVHPWVRAPESVGLTKFVPYFAEVFRTTWTNFNQALLDLERANNTENPKAAAIMRNAGLQRLFGSLSASFLLPVQFPVLSTATGLMAFGLLPGGEDEEENEKRRWLVGEFNRYQDLVKMGKDVDGNPIYLPISQRIDPNGPFTDILRTAIMAGDTDDGVRELKKLVTDMFILPTWGKRMINNVTKPGSPENRFERVFPELQEASRNVARSMGVSPVKADKFTYVMDSWLPGVISGYDPKYSPKFDATTHGQWVGGMETLKALGTSYEVFKPDNALRGYSVENKEKQKDARAVLNQTVLRESALSDTDMREAVLSYAAAERERWIFNQKTVNGLRAWDYTDEEIGAMLVKHGWGKKEVKRMLNDDAVSYISKKSLKSTTQNLLKGALSPSEEDKLKKQYERAADMLDAMGDDLTSMGVEVTSD